MNARGDQSRRRCEARRGRLARVSGSIVVAALTTAALGDIDLEFRANVVTCEIVNVGLYAVSDNDQDQSLSAVQAVFAWDPAALQLEGLDQKGAVPLLLSEFPLDDIFGLNETVPPANGDGLYTAFAFLGSPVLATPAGTLLTTFVLVPAVPTSTTGLDLLAQGGDPSTETIVFDGDVPGLDVTGRLVGVALAHVDTCLADLSRDCVVDIADILIVLQAWGLPDDDADLDGDGRVGFGDLLIILGHWGNCS